MIQRQPVFEVRGVPDGPDVAPELAIAAQLAVRLGRCTAKLVPRLAMAAMHLSGREGWKPLGFAHASDFARERLDRSGSWLRQLARLGRACREMPALAEAITGEDGGKPLGRAAAYEICRVARPDTVADWIQRARGCTIREFKEMVRHTRDGEPCVEATPASRRRDSLRMHLPVFLRGALPNFERVFLATNPGSRRQDLLEALTAEHASGSTGATESTDPATSPPIGPSRRLRVVSGTPEHSIESNLLIEIASCEAPEHTTTSRELLQARWTLHRAQMFVASLESDANPDANPGDKAGTNTGTDATTPVRQLEQSMRDILALEYEVQLRIDALLLWLDHRRAWSLLGFADATEFGQRALDESASTMRNRLRLAGAMERSTALRRSAESARLSHQRLVRLAQLMDQRVDKHSKLTGCDETVMQQWVDHSAQIPVKRLDEDLDAVERRRWSDPADPADPTRLPPPPTDAEWQASLRLVPGDARRRLLLGGLRALATDAPANVCHRFTGPADVIRDLRQSLNRTRVQLAEQGRHLVEDRDTYSPADESRLFPSIRLAARHIERGTPIPDWICLLALLEEFAEEWDNPRHMPRRPTDAIASRDGWRCTAPGCTSREIEVHHIVYRSHGGSDDPSNLTSLCPFHHRMGEHGGLLKLTGTAPLNLRWHIGDRVFVNERLVSGGP